MQKICFFVSGQSKAHRALGRGWGRGKKTLTNKYISACFFFVFFRNHWHSVHIVPLACIGFLSLCQLISYVQCHLSPYWKGPKRIWNQFSRNFGDFQFSFKNLEKWFHFLFPLPNEAISIAKTKLLWWHTSKKLIRS